MTPTIAQAILLAVAVAATLFLIHRFSPTGAVAKAEDKVIGAAEKVEPALQADAMQALTAVETFLTDVSAERAAIVKANASMATKQHLLRQHIASLSAALPADIPESAGGVMPSRLRLELAGGLAIVAALLAFAFWPAAPIHEDVAPAPQVRQTDNSVIAERAPDAHPPAPRHIIPKGYVEERREAIVVTPAPAASSVEVDLSLVRQGDQRRVIASSPDGQVVSAIDIPIEPVPIPPAPMPWAAGLSWDTRHAVGVWLDRNVGRAVVGVALARLPDGKVEAQVRAGVRF